MAGLESARAFKDRRRSKDIVRYENGLEIDAVCHCGQASGLHAHLAPHRIMYRCSGFIDRRISPAPEQFPQEAQAKVKINIDVTNESPLVPILPTDADARNSLPMCDGLLDYFPLALAEVSKVSFVGNQQHNPGQPMHWARNKSTDHANKIMKHLVDRGTFDTDKMRHSAKIAWRALALLEEELEAEVQVSGRASKW